MRLFRYILIIIAIVSIAGCFGFSAAAARPDSLWDGESRLAVNRNYILNKKTVLSSDMVVPEGSFLVLDRFGELVIPEGVSLTVNGTISIENGGTVTNYGNIYVDGSGSVSVSGNFIGEDKSETEIDGELTVNREGNLHLTSKLTVSDTGFLGTEGRVSFKRESLVANYGEIHVHSSGEILNTGRIIVAENGAFECRGSLTNERKGTINNYGSISLEEDSFYAAMGKLSVFDNGRVIDNSNHKDWSIYTAEILKNEEEVVKRGIDVSYAQGEIDWETLSKSGIDFVIIRCGRGDIDGTGPQADIRFYENIEAANKYGIDAGVYFYTYAETVAQAEQEAEFMLTILEGYTITYPVILDIEESTRRKDLSHIAEAFLEVVAEGGYYPMIYSYQNMLDNHFSAELKEKYAVWVARLKHKPETDYDYYIWQYSHDGEIVGIKGDVDFDTAYRDFPEILRDYGLNHLTPTEE